METDAAIISRIDDSGQSLQLFAARSHLLQKKWQSLSDSHNEMGPEAICLATDQPLLIENFSTQNEFPKPSYLSPTFSKKLSSAAIVPLKGYRRVLGTISVFDEKPNAFDASDIHFLQSVASIFSLAIERRRSEQELESSREKLDIILHTIADGIFAQTKEGKILYANQAALTASGYSFPEGIQEELSEDDRVALLTEALAQIEFRNQDGKVLRAKDLPAARAIETQQTHIATIQFSGPNHRRSHWALVKASPVFNEHHEIEYVVNVLTDITELKETETQLERYKERFELAQRSGNVGVFEWDIQHDSIWWSSGEEALFQVPAGSFKDEFRDRATFSHWANRIHPLDRTAVRAKIAEAILEKRKSHENEFRIVYASGEVRWIKSMAQIYYSPEGEAMRMVGVNFDITDQIHKEQRKDEFISMASHELKTPLTSIKAFSQMMLKKINKKELHADKFTQYLGRIEGQVNKLNKLVSDLLDVTKIQQGQLQLERHPHSINSLLKEVVTTIHHAYPTHSIELNLKDELTANIDADRLEQVVTNLLTNAVKYSPENSQIVVSLKEENNSAIISVRDYGIGIPQKHHKNITRRFYRAEKGDETKYPGLGIGLYIARQIMEEHDGKLWFTSKKGKGSTFYISLPLHI